MELLTCSLCHAQTELFYQTKRRKYFQCNNCFSIMLDPNSHVSQREEKARYQTHNNDIEDKRYQHFVSPIVESVLSYYTSNHFGLDFGAGTGPVITSQLKKEGFQINLYDPYFHYYPSHLLIKYDYIICCEVMEHFYDPYYEFMRLSSLLKSGESIFCMTKLYDESIDFSNWNYKDDQTHVFFYHKKAIEWIKIACGFTDAVIEGRLIRFLK